MHEFPFKEADKEGLETLMAISKADAFNKWMYDTVSPCLHGNILEIGSGIGNISKYFINDKKQITLSDVRDNYCDLLKNYFAKEKNPPEILKINLAEPQFDLVYRNQHETYDSLFSLNVIEHIKDDKTALRNAASLLKPGGVMVTLVPAIPFLYNNLDKELHHYRRYNKKQLMAHLQSAGLSTKKTLYFNALGIAGWLVSGKILNRRNISSTQMNIYNAIIPMAKTLDRILKPVAGLSIICISEKRP